MLDPNKHGVFDKKRKRRPNWPMIAILCTAVLIWYLIFSIGFFKSMAWIMVGTGVIALYFKLKEERW